MKLQKVLMAAVLIAFIAPKAFALTDGEIAEVMMNANKAEIDAGKLAKSKAADSSVKDFAEHMVQAHEDNQKEGKKVTKDEKIKARSTEDSKDLKKDSKDKIADLKSKKGLAFDKAYIDNQVAMHQQLLNDLDQKFIPQAQNPEFKIFLTETRKHVEEHLSSAKEIQTSLNK